MFRARGLRRFGSCCVPCHVTDPATATSLAPATSNATFLAPATSNATLLYLLQDHVTSNATSRALLQDHVTSLAPATPNATLL